MEPTTRNLFRNIQLTLHIALPCIAIWLVLAEAGRQWQASLAHDGIMTEHLSTMFDWLGYSMAVIVMGAAISVIANIETRWWIRTILQQTRIIWLCSVAFTLIVAFAINMDKELFAMLATLHFFALDPVLSTEQIREIQMGSRT